MGPQPKTVVAEVQKERINIDFIRNGVLYDVKCKDPNRPSIPQFFRGKDIFITGGTGFMGRVLIEKLTRSCPDINQIFILMREKKGKSLQERLNQLVNLELFSVLCKKSPELLKKLVPIEGDVTLLKLGVSDEDYKKMENVSVIFHSAASVKFDDPLQYAILLNTRGTREVMRFAETLKNLKVVMHVSTTYCNIKTQDVKETVYPPLADWEASIKIAENMDSYTFDMLAAKYMNFMPNTYTFSKHLAEQVVHSYKGKIPIVLFRPSIVISTMKDPFPGWIDNFNGPIGLLVGCGIGITRTMYCNPHNVADFTPVDVVIKAMVVGAWLKGIEEQKSDSLPVYNASTATIRQLSMEGIISVSKTLVEDMPLEKMIWVPGGSITTSRIVNFIKTMMLHVLPALILDSVLKFAGQKQFILSLQRKVFNANCCLAYFILNNWTFHNENFLMLDNEIKEEDARDFHFTDFVQFDMMIYFKNCVRGAKNYLLGEKEEDIPKAIKKYRYLQRIDLTLKTIFSIILIYFLFFYFDTIELVTETFLYICSLLKFW